MYDDHDLDQEPSWLDRIIAAGGDAMGGAMATFNRPAQVIRSGAVDAFENPLSGNPLIDTGAYAGRNLLDAFNRTDDAQSLPDRIGDALDASQGRYDALKDAIDQYDPTGGYLGGAARIGLDMATDPMTYVGGPLTKWETAGALAGGAGAMLDGGDLSPTERSRKIQDWSDMGQFAGGVKGVAHAVPKVGGVLDNVDDFLGSLSGARQELGITYGRSGDVADIIADLMGFKAKNAANAALPVEHVDRGRLGLRPEYNEGSIERQTWDRMMESARTQEDHLARPDPSTLPGTPRPANVEQIGVDKDGYPINRYTDPVTGEEIEGGLAGKATSVDDLRAIADVGRPAQHAYTHYGEYWGRELSPEAVPLTAALFGITSAQTKLPQNFAATPWVFDQLLQMEAAGVPGAAKEIQAVFGPIADASRGHKGGHPELWSFTSGTDSIKAGKGPGGAKTYQVAKLVEGTTSAIGRGKDKILSRVPGLKLVSGPKTPQFADATVAGLTREFTPAYVMDTHDSAARGYADPSKAMSTEQASRSAGAVGSYTAAEAGLPPMVEQAAIWEPKRQFTEGAGWTQRLWEQFASGARSLADIIQEARTHVNKDGSVGLAEPDPTAGSRNNPMLDKNLAALKATQAATGKQVPYGLKNAMLTYKGKKDPTGRWDFNPEVVAMRRAEANAQAPAIVIDHPQALDALGFQPDQNKLDWIDLPHHVTRTDTGVQIDLPGGNIDTARYFGSLIGEPLGLDSVRVRLPSSTAETRAGLALEAPEGAAWTPDDLARARLATRVKPLLSNDSRMLELALDDEHDPAALVAALEEAGFGRDRMRSFSSDEHDVPLAEMAQWRQLLGRRFAASNAEVNAADGSRATRRALQAAMIARLAALRGTQ